MFARFDENPAMTLRVIKETKRYEWTDGRTDNVKTVYPLQTKFAGGIISIWFIQLFLSFTCMHILKFGMQKYNLLWHRAVKMSKMVIIFFVP